ncbi:MAG: inositol monophosphatase family protein [Pseudomonadota bacterium]
MNDCLKLAQKLAKKAGKIQLDNLKKHHTIEFKGAINLVTEVDKACERLIVDSIRKKFPDHDILAEEGSGHERGADYKWIIDPLDGTVNYAHNFPFFGVSIALEFKGELVMGVIYDPIRRELFHAVKGNGAFLNSKRIHVSDRKPLKNAMLGTGFAYNVQEEDQLDNIDNFRNFIKTARAVRRPGAASIDFAYVACGRLDGFWELFLKSWDMAAGVVIIREAGGTVTSFDGSAYDLYGTEILCSNGLIHGEMITILVNSKLQIPNNK